MNKNAQYLAGDAGMPPIILSNNESMQSEFHQNFSDAKRNLYYGNPSEQLDSYISSG